MRIYQNIKTPPRKKRAHCFFYRNFSNTCDAQRKTSTGREVKRIFPPPLCLSRARSFFCPSLLKPQETRVPNHASNRWLQDPLRECARNANDNGGHARSLLDAGAATDDTDGVRMSPLLAPRMHMNRYAPLHCCLKPREATILACAATS